MGTKTALLKSRGKYFEQSNTLSELQFASNISNNKSIEIKEQQQEAFNKYKFMKELSKAYDKELKKEEDDFTDCFFCSNCRELYSIDEMGTSELARQDRICKYCMEERGYGR